MKQNLKGTLEKTRYIFSIEVWMEPKTSLDKGLKITLSDFLEYYMLRK